MALALLRLPMPSVCCQHRVACALATSLPRVSSARDLSLNVAYHDLGPAGISPLCLALPQLTWVVGLVLDLRRCGLGDAGVKVLSAAAVALPGLQRLDLRLGFNRVSDTGALSLATELENRVRRLLQLSLALDINEICVGGACNILRVASHACSKQLHLDLGHNKIRGKACVGFAKLLLESRPEKLPASMRLDLRGNKLRAGRNELREAATALISKGHDISIDL